MSDTITIRVLGPDDVEVLDRVRPGTFDEELNPVYSWAFLSTGVNAIVVAMDRGDVIGFASGTVILHPDKPRQFYISELGVHGDFEDQGIAERLMERLRNVAAERGCEEMWGVADTSNVTTQDLFKSLGGAESPGQIKYSFDLTTL